MEKRMRALLLLIIPFCLHAQPDSVSTAVLHTNNLSVHFRSDGLLWQNEAGGPGLWHYSNDDQDSVALAKQAGFWWSAVDPGGNPLLTGTEVEQNPFRSGFQGVPESAGRIWRITREEISQHREDWLDNQYIDDPLPGIFGWPGAFNEYFEYYNGYNQPEFVNYAFADFWDQDFDGRYEPDEGDYPLFPAGCMNIYSMPGDMIWFPFYALKDTLSEQSFLQLSLSAFAFDCQGDEILANSMLIDVRSSNQYIDQLDSLIISMFWNTATHDFVGIDTEERHPVTFTYSDTQASTLPLMGLSVHLGPFNEIGEAVDIVAHNVLYPDFLPALGWPITFSEYRNVQRGRWSDGRRLTASGLGYDTDGDLTRFAYDGLPESGDWTELQSDNSLGDRVSITSFEAVGTFMGQQERLAYTLAVEPDYTELDQGVGLLESKLDSLILAYSCDIFPIEDLAPSCNLDFLVGTTEPMLDMQLFPNPTNSRLNIQFPSLAVEALTIYDYTGKRIYAQSITDEWIEIDVSNWPPGMYLVRFAPSNEVHKVIVH